MPRPGRQINHLAMAQADYRLAEENVASSDTLYSIGLQRHKIAAISRADLLTLQLDKGPVPADQGLSGPRE